MNVYELLYLEISNPNPKEICQWLHLKWQPSQGKKIITDDGIRIELADQNS